MSDVIPSWTYPLQRGDKLTSNDWTEWHFHDFLESSFVANALFQDRRDVIGTAIILWSAAYRQDPAGCLPDDPVQLARIAGYGRDVAAWSAIAPLALVGWTPCYVKDKWGDPQIGFLGHPFIADIAERSWRRKHAKVVGREAARMATLRSRVKKAIARVGSPKLAESAHVVQAVADWLDQNQLFVTEENVRAGLETAAGVPKMRVVSTAKGGAFED